MSAVDNNDDAPPKKMSIADRIAALNNKQEEQLPSLTKPKANKIAIADKIAALKVSATTTNGNDDERERSDKPKVGKLKPPPPGAVPIMFRAGRPSSLASKKQKEREERMNKLKQEAQADDNGVNGGDNSSNDESTDKTKKLPSGGSLPPGLLKKQKEREERLNKLKQEAQDTTPESTDVAADVGTNDEKKS